MRVCVTKSWESTCFGTFQEAYYESSPEIPTTPEHHTGCLHIYVFHMPTRHFIARERGQEPWKTKLMVRVAITRSVSCHINPGPKSRAIRQQAMVL
jgi:hypothetical protein